MGPDKPVRKDPLSGATEGDISPELREQLAGRQRRKAEARKRSRPKMTYDLPERMIEAVNTVADGESVPRSDIVALALARFLDAYEAGDVEIDGLKIPTKSLRVQHKLDLGEKWT